MRKKDPAAAKALEEQLAKLTKEHPILAIMAGVVLYKVLVDGAAKPKWLKNVGPVNTRTAGPWRGKGSFGKSFGTQQRHRS